VKKEPIHYLPASQNTTECGIRCWPCDGYSSEADTETNERIDYTSVERKTTCKACLHEIERAKRRSGAA